MERNKKAAQASKVIDHDDQWGAALKNLAIAMGLVLFLTLGVSTLVVILAGYPISGGPDNTFMAGWLRIQNIIHGCPLQLRAAPQNCVQSGQGPDSNAVVAFLAALGLAIAVALRAAADRTVAFSDRLLQGAQGGSMDVRRFIQSSLNFWITIGCAIVVVGSMLILAFSYIKDENSRIAGLLAILATVFVGSEVVTAVSVGWDVSGVVRPRPAEEMLKRREGAAKKLSRFKIGFVAISLMETLLIISMGVIIGIRGNLEQGLSAALVTWMGYSLVVAWAEWVGFPAVYPTNTERCNLLSAQLLIGAPLFSLTIVLTVLFPDYQLSEVLSPRNRATTVGVVIAAIILFILLFIRSIGFLGWGPLGFPKIYWALENERLASKKDLGERGGVWWFVGAAGWMVVVFLFLLCAWGRSDDGPWQAGVGTLLAVFSLRSAVIIRRYMQFGKGLKVELGEPLRDSHPALVCLLLFFPGGGGIVLVSLFGVFRWTCMERGFAIAALVAVVWVALTIMPVVRTWFAIYSDVDSGGEDARGGLHPFGARVWHLMGSAARWDDLRMAKRYALTQEQVFELEDVATTPPNI